MTSGAFEGNRRSLGVSDRVGYVPNGTKRHPRPGADQDGWRTEHLVVLTPETFVRPPHPVIYEGVEEFKAFIGLAG